MLNKLTISFPHMGDYHIPISRLLKDVFPEAEVFAAPPITQKTLALGNRHSPDFVCSPFKYNIGNYIEALEKGANILLQTGMGCRYGYYGEVQEQILRDLGYSFEFVCLSRDRAKPAVLYKTCKRLNPDMHMGNAAHAFLLAVERIWAMDKLDKIFRERVGFEVEKGAFEKAKKCFLVQVEKADTLLDIRRAYQEYREIYFSIKADIPRNPLRVGIVGELYTIMEPFGNHEIERQLARAGIMISRRMSVTFLLFGKHTPIAVRRSKGYLQNAPGANGADSVSQCMQYAKQGYDGVLHIKSFGCTPELSAQPALMNLSRDRNLPILHLSFDAQTSETGLQTRIEAFIDMIKMRRGRA